jgi:hypothetical protein
VIGNDEQYARGVLGAIATHKRPLIIPQFYMELMSVDNLSFHGNSTLSAELISTNALVARKVVNSFLLENLEVVWSGVVKYPDLTKQFYPFVHSALKYLSTLAAPTKRNSSLNI